MSESWKESELARWGWDDRWDELRRERNLPLSRVARIVSAHRIGFLVAQAGRSAEARFPGRLRKQVAEGLMPEPAVGDFVSLEASNNPPRVIASLFPRRSVVERREPGLERKSQVMAANIDLGLIVQPVIEIDAARKIERFVAFLHDCSVPPLLVLTKADLIPADPELRAAVETFVASCRERVDTLVLSNETGEGHEALRDRLPAGLTAALFGASGVGKSSLLNRLSGSTLHRTALVDADGKGRHTTTHRQLVSTAEGLLLLDMPGIRELGLLNNDDLDAAFEEIATLAPNCRFRDCAHLREPDCAVRAALGQGKLTADRLDHWHKLREERLARERLNPKLSERR